MRSIFKKNQVIISVIALMLIAAGYMSYTTNTNNEIAAAKLKDAEEYANLGDAQLVSSPVANNEETNEEITNNETTQASNETTNEVVDTSAGNSYFTESKLEREKMYSQMIESYQKILENTQVTDTQKEIAQNEVAKINKTKNAIMISENLIKNKDFSDVVIFVNGNSVNVVVKEKSLKTEQIAQIQNIITREIENDIENIHISCKE